VENGSPAHGHHAKGARIDSTELDIVVPFLGQIVDEHELGLCGNEWNLKPEVKTFGAQPCCRAPLGEPQLDFYKSTCAGKDDLGAFSGPSLIP